MRIVVTGDAEWNCPELAASTMRRLIARYGPDITIIVGAEQGVTASFATAANDMGIRVEPRVIDRGQTSRGSYLSRESDLNVARIAHKARSANIL